MYTLRALGQFSQACRYKRALGIGLKNKLASFLCGFSPDTSFVDMFSRHGHLFLQCYIHLLIQ